MDQKIELLRRVPLFARFGKHDLEQVSRLVDEVDVPAGRELLHQGEFGHEFFVISEGSVRVERDGKALRTLGPGDFLGEIALLDGGVRSATATADGPCRLLVLGHREFHSLLEQFPSVRTAVLEGLAARVRQLQPDLEN
jgi:CRP-like cAMP-binding protein